MISPHKLSATDVKPEWIEMIREMLGREGVALQCPPGRPVIMAKRLKPPSINLWVPLLLQDSATAFTSISDRDQIYSQLIKS